MKETLAVINQMQADGVVGKYAIGGAVGATFYLEPAATVDIDIFVIFQHDPNVLLLSLAPIYEYLSRRGYRVEGEYIIVEGWHVQFLPPGSPLEEEAIQQANSTELDGVPTWVMQAEHLVAIALKLGRPKDNNRILSFVESGKLDSKKLDEILKGHQLLEKWGSFCDRFLKEI